MAERKPLKIGVREGSGPEPGYQWSVAIIDEAYEEAIDVLGVGGYDHFSMQVKQLAMQDSPTQSAEVDVKGIDEFYEIRDHGGVHGNVNVRVFFGLDNHRRTIVVLGTIKKQNNGPTPTVDKVTMRRRWRSYMAGDFGFIS